MDFGSPSQRGSDAVAVSFHFIMIRDGDITGGTWIKEAVVRGAREMSGRLETPFALLSPVNGFGPARILFVVSKSSACSLRWKPGGTST